MWQDMFVLDVPLVEKVIRTVLVYALILVLVRLGGRRGLATMNTLDVVVALLLASAVQNAIIGDDLTIVGGAVSAVALVTMNSAINRLVHASPLAARMLKGRATTVIEHGKEDQDALRRLQISRSELDHAIRDQHGDDISEVEHGQLTPSGRLVLTLKHDEQSSTKGDIAALADRLRRVEALLAEGRRTQSTVVGSRGNVPSQEAPDAPDGDAR
jgi:uncharacterized membrane protein YcaP (DUF421 family)